MKNAQVNMSINRPINRPINKQSEQSQAAVSIIVPVRNEASHIALLIEYLRGLPQSEQAEIIVCDGASEDETVAQAESAGARVLRWQPNRGAQQNAGAHIATGEILWFLHADARPHPQSLEYLLRLAGQSEICGGNFRLRFDAGGIMPRLFEYIARVQRRRGTYYGDSAIWMRRDVFNQLGGFAPWPLFEDYDFARRLERFARRSGARTEYSRLPVTVSARRFQKAPLRVLMQWTRLQLLFLLGVAPDRLAAMYFGKKR